MSKDFFINKIVFVCIIYILFLAFFSDSGDVPFISRPGLFFWLPIFTIFLLRLLQTKRVINIAAPIPIVLFVYLIIFLIVTIFHVNDMIFGFGLLALYLSFIVYIVLFFTIFYNKTVVLSALTINYIYLIIILQALIAILEFHLVTNDIVSRDMLWNNSVEHYVSYSKRSLDFFWYRPLGVFGQPTYNSIIPVLAFFALIYFKRIANKNCDILKIYRENFFMLVIVVANVIYSGSVTGYLLLLFMLLIVPLFYNPKFFLKYFPVLIALLVSIAMLDLYIIEYIRDAYIVNQLATAEYYSVISQADFSQFLVGFEGTIDFPISLDTNLYFLIGKMGFIGLLTYIISYAWIFYLLKNTELRIFLVALFFGSLHYVVLGNQTVHILVALLIAYYLLEKCNMKKKRSLLKSTI